MKHLFFIFLILFSPSLLAFDITPVDDTEDGVIEAKRNKTAPDGKTIFNPIEVSILKPMKVTIIKGYKPTVEQVQRKIIYPIGALPPKSIEPESKEAIQIPPKQEENIFLSSDSINKNKTDKININIDTDFKKSSGATTPEKPKTITPVNIE